MLLDVAVIVVLFFIVVILAVLVIRNRYIIQELRDEIDQKSQNATHTRNKLAEIEASAKEAIEQEKKRTIAGLLQKYNAGDAGFINTVAGIYEKKEIRFVLDTAHRRIYEAALMETDGDRIVNAIGKGKGIRLLEIMLANPETIVDNASNEAQDEHA